MPKSKFLYAAEELGFYSDNKIKMIANITAKVINLFLAVIFFVLRSKAKSAGKKGKSRVFLALGIMFFLGAFVANTGGAEEITDTSEDFDDTDALENEL